MSRRAPLRTLAATVAVAALLVGVPAAAQEGSTTSTTQPGATTSTTEPGTPTEDELPPLGELPEISDALADVALTSETYDEVFARREEVAEARADAERREEAEQATIEEATAREAELTRRIGTVRARAERWEAEAARLDDEVRAVAVGSYMRGASDDVGPLFSMDAEAHNRAATSAITSETLARRQVEELEHARSVAKRARNQETLSISIREGVRDAMAEARIARDEAKAEKERLAIELVEAQKAIEGQRRMATVVGADFPLVVLDAYWKAAETMRLLAPGCGIQWWAMAGIGKIESRHGTYGGSEVRADGSLTKPIIGIPLTGANNTAAIGDSDGGLIDGDPTVDRAAGPMQFIPQTWQAYGVDGDQNGTIQIQNIYDAAASAARYLCAAAGSMSDLAGLQRGYFSYNHSAAYVSSVLAQAVRYGNAVEIEGVPAPPTPPPPPPTPETPGTTGTPTPPAAGTTSSTTTAPIVTPPG